MAFRILQGDVFDMLPTIEPGSVDCAVTSPPYWMLRSYLPKDHPLKPLELGSEKTPAKYVEKMVGVFRLVRECLAEHGTCWVNVGDTYWTAKGSCYNPGGGPMSNITNHKDASAHPLNRGNKSDLDLEPGNLCLIPQRLAIALQDDGWIVRSVIVWHKPAPMPSSVSGWAWRRCRVKVKAGNCNPDTRKGGPEYTESHAGFDARWYGGDKSQWSDCPGCSKCKPTGGYVLRRGSWRPTSSWEPILMLAKSRNYFCDGEAVKQPAASATISRNEYPHNGAFVGQFAGSPIDERFQDGKPFGIGGFPTTANLRDVWTIASEPLKAKHYAAYPSELVHRCLKAGTSARGYCRECGKPWVRVIGETTYSKHRPSGGNDSRSRGEDKFSEANGTGGWRGNNLIKDPIETLGWRPSCEHNGDPRPGLVLDPFAGSGRTAVEAHRLGLDFVGCELNPEYVDMANGIIGEEAGLFAEQMERSRR